MCFSFVFMQQDFDQNKLEEEMRKRKERVEKWREEQRKKAIENIGEIKKELEEMKQGKKWSLEDDDGEEVTEGNTVGLHEQFKLFKLCLTKLYLCDKPISHPLFALILSAN